MFNLYNGDCLEIMNKIPDNSVDLVLCDLPYGTTSNKWDVVLPFDILWSFYNRIVKSKGCLPLNLPYLMKKNSGMTWFGKNPNAVRH